MRLSGTFSKRHLAAALVVLSGASALAGHGLADWIRCRADLLLSPLCEPIMVVASPLRERIETLGSRTSDDQEKRRLSEENDSLARAYALLKRDYDSSQRAQADRAHYEKQFSFRCELIEAGVTGSDPLPYSSSVTVASRRKVAAGSYVAVVTDRLKALPENLSVVDPSVMAGAMVSAPQIVLRGQLVGRVLAASEFTARVQLVTDRDFHMEALIIRNPAVARQVIVKQGNILSRQALTLANNQEVPVRISGDGKGRIVARDVSTDYNVMPGDWIVTHGPTRYFPADPYMPDNMYVGRIAQVQADGRAAQRVIVTAEPYAKLNTLRSVYIVLPLQVPEVPE